METVANHDQQAPHVLNRGAQSAQTPHIQLENGNKPQVLVDWLSFTFPMPEWSRCERIHDDNLSECLGDHRTAEDVAEEAAREIADWLRIDPDAWHPGPGRYHYTKRLSQKHVDILYAGAQPGMGIHIQITGQGCRTLEAEGRVRDWETFLNEIAARHGRVTRIDGALDDRAGILDMRRIYEAWIDGHATSHYKEIQAQMPKLALGCGEQNPVPETLYFGDPRKGRSGIRIYNKQVEQIAKGHEDPGPWIRVELVAKADQAPTLTQAIHERGFVEAITGAIKAKLDFKEPGDNAQKTRWQTVDWWQTLLGTAIKVRISRKPPTRTIYEKLQWLDKTVAKNLALVAMAHNNDPITLNYLLRSGEERLKPADRALIREYLEVAGL